MALCGKQRNEGGKKRRKVPPEPPGGFNEITPQKIELVWPTEGRNARN